MSARNFYCSIALFLGLSAMVQAAPLQDLHTVEKELQAFLLSTLQSSEHEAVKVAVNSIDKRLRLRACDNSLTFKPQGNPHSASNVTVKVQCDGDVRWSLFISARVQRLAEIVIADRALARGAQLGLGDLRTETRDVNRLGYGYVTRLDDVGGQQLRRPLRAGDAIRARALEAPMVVAKGDELVVVAKNGAIKVVVPGVALSNGKLGQQIKVQNSRSERVFKARVVAPGRVQVVL